MLVLMPHLQEVFSTCEPLGVWLYWFVLYKTCINTTTQEVLSMALGAE